MEGENPRKEGDGRLSPGSPRICLPLLNSLSFLAPPRLLPGWLAGWLAGTEAGVMARWGEALSWESGDLVPVCPHHCPMGRLLPHSVPPSCHLSTEREPHFWVADIGNCTWGVSTQKGGLSPVQRRRGEGRGATGRLLTAIPLVQAIGAVLDPVAGGHTESVHRAEELPRARCGGGCH